MELYLTSIFLAFVRVVGFDEAREVQNEEGRSRV